MANIPPQMCANLMMNINIRVKLCLPTDVSPPIVKSCFAWESNKYHGNQFKTFMQCSFSKFFFFNILLKLNYNKKKKNSFLNKLTNLAGDQIFIIPILWTFPMFCLMPCFCLVIVAHCHFCFLHCQNLIICSVDVSMLFQWPFL